MIDSLVNPDKRIAPLMNHYYSDHWSTIVITNSFSNGKIAFYKSWLTVAYQIKHLLKTIYLRIDTNFSKIFENIYFFIVYLIMILIEYTHINVHMYIPLLLLYYASRTLSFVSIRFG